jgi:hypothetical protein
MDPRSNGGRRRHLRDASRDDGGGNGEGPGKRPRPGRGRLQWNTWGWFGGQIGSTIWLLVIGVIALTQGALLGLVPVACCLVANVAGTLLWWRRDRLPPYAALQGLLAVITAVSAVTVATAVEGGLLGADPTTPPGRWVYLYVLIFPALMIQLWAVDRGGRGGDGSRGDSGPD